MSDKKQAYENVLSMIKSKKEHCERCRDNLREENKQEVAQIFSYEVKLCQKFIDTIQEWTSEESGDVEDELLAATRENQKRKADKDLMNSKCSGELGVWND